MNRRLRFSILAVIVIMALMIVSSSLRAGEETKKPYFTFQVSMAEDKGRELLNKWIGRASPTTLVKMTFVTQTKEPDKWFSFSNKPRRGGGETNEVTGYSIDWENNRFGIVWYECTPGPRVGVENNTWWIMNPSKNDWQLVFYKGQDEESRQSLASGETQTGRLSPGWRRVQVNNNDSTCSLIWWERPLYEVYLPYFNR